MQNMQSDTSMAQGIKYYV